MYSLQEFRFRELVASPPTDSAYNAALRMENKHVGCVLVTQNDKILGIATRYDFVHSIIVAGKDAKNTPIKEIMHASPVTVDCSITTAEALRTMVRKRVERLVVISGQKILGVLSLEDIVAGLEATSTLNSLSKERSDQVRDMIKKLTPYLVARYDGDEKEELKRDMNDEVKALLRLLEEVEISLRP